MKAFRTTVLTATLAGALMAGASASAQERAVPGEAVTVTVTVEAIDAATRTLTIKDATGIVEIVHVPEEIRRFSELKVGDRITARYQENFIIRLKKPGEPGVVAESAAVTRGVGPQPSASTAAQRTITATVTAMDPATLAVTVMGPNGYSYRRRVADKATFALLKVGDRLEITWIEDVLISVDTPKP